MGKRIFYCSKYALNEKQGGPTRQYFFSKNFAKQDIETILISSNASGGKHLKFRGKKTQNKSGNFTHIILKGSLITLGFSIRRLCSWLTFEYRLFNELRRQKLSAQDTLIVSSLSILTFLNGLYFKKYNGIKLVVEVRDIWPLTLVEMSNYKNLVKILTYPLKLLERKAYQNADVIISSMPNLKAHIKKVDPSLNPKKIVHIPMGFDQRYNPTGELKPNKKFYVGYAGSIGLVNKVDLIIDAANVLKQEKNIKFKILGDGPLKKTLEQKVDALKLDNVVFYDKVEKSKVYEFLINCNLLVHPIHNLSIYEYGVSPNKWIDYMYAAKPIIIPYNGYQSIINEANCGKFIETDNPITLAQTITQFYSKPKNELTKMGQNGKDYLFQNLNYKTLAKKYLEAISN